MKLQLKNLTWSDFGQHKPCYSPRKRYGYFSGTILDILEDERIPNVDKIWAFTRKGIMDDKTLRLFAVRCARQVQHLMKDPRSINALDVAEKYANGLATDNDLTVAREAAVVAVGESSGEAARTAARESAGEAVGEIAWEAAWGTALEAMAAARAAAWKASWKAGEAQAARAAAREAAWEAAWATQVQIAIDLINEFYEEPKPKNKFIKLNGLIEKLITFVKSINLLKLWRTS